MLTHSSATSRRAAVRRSSVISATLVLVGATALSGVVFSPASAEDAATATDTSATWTEKTPSVDEAPAELAASVDSNDVAQVVSVREENGQPVFDSVPVVGNTQAQAVVAQEQADDETIAVVVQEKKQFLTALSNDPYRKSQWAMNTLQAEKAWGVSKGAGQTVAVVDTGVARVPDLVDSLVPGVDYINGTNGQVDPLGHGTHVSGIIAAKADNRIGVAGLAPKAKIMPVRVLDRTGKGYSSQIAAGITYAANAGASVINLSLGGDRSADIEVAVNYAVSKGRVVVAAAGNKNSATVLYPAGYSNVIAVAATRWNDTRAAFSNYGRHVDVAAPGEDIGSTVPQGRYEAWSGTSMATPYVSATVALLRSAAVAKHLGAVNVKKAMEATAKDIGPVGWDKYTGAGRINPYAALCHIGACAKARTTARVGLAKSVLSVQVVPATSRLVLLQRFESNKWSSVTVRQTNATGAVRFAVSTRGVYRVVVIGTIGAEQFASSNVRFTP